MLDFIAFLVIITSVCVLVFWVTKLFFDMLTTRFVMPYILARYRRRLLLLGLSEEEADVKVQAMSDDWERDNGDR